MALLGGVATTLNAAVPGLPLGDILLGLISQFKKGYVFQIVDLSDPLLPIATKSLVLNPRKYTLSEPFSVTLTPTEDNTVVAEESGQIIREIVIEGTTGYKKRVEDAFGAGGLEQSGPDHFHDLRNFFRQYSTLKQLDADNAANIQMHFHNVKEDDHFVVVPRSFETPRDAATGRMHFHYKISLAAIQPLPPPKLPGDLFGIFGPDVANVLHIIAIAVYQSRALLVELLSLVENFRERVRDPSAFFTQVALSINAANQLVDGVVDSIILSKEIYKSVSALGEEIQEMMENDIDRDPYPYELATARSTAALTQAINEIAAQPSKFEPPLAGDVGNIFAGPKNFTESDLKRNEAGATIGSRTRLVFGNDAQAGLNLGSFGGSKGVLIGAGDSIDTIANKYRVPREAVIALNRLVFPYIVRGGGPGTLQPGDTLLIPLRNARQRSGAAPTAPYMTPDEIVYGNDMALDMRLAEEGVFDILVDTAHGSMDASLVRGKANVVQGVQILLGTELGSTSVIPDLGIRRTPGTKGTINNMLSATVALREGILGDSRVRSIRSMRVVLRGDVLTQEITPVLINERDGVVISVPFGKASR